MLIGNNCCCSTVREAIMGNKRSALPRLHSADEWKRYHVSQRKRGAMARSKKASVGRRYFLKGTVGGAAARVPTSPPAPAQQEEAARSATPAAVTEERDPSPSVEVLT